MTPAFDLDNLQSTHTLLPLSLPPAHNACKATQGVLLALRISGILLSEIKLLQSITIESDSTQYTIKTETLFLLIMSV